MSAARGVSDHPGETVASLENAHDMIQIIDEEGTWVYVLLRPWQNVCRVA